MSEPIDLDLVELRCRLRGWETSRFKDENVTGGYAEDGIECHTPDGRIYALADGEYGGDDIASERHEHILTAPRWTLARLLSEPPEGWTYDKDDDSLVYGSDQETNEYDIAFFLPSDARSSRPRQMSAASRRHDTAPSSLSSKLKAAAELAYILAEIQP